MLFAKAERPTPLLNIPHFSTVFSHPLPLDKQGLLRPIEMVALPNTPFTIVKKMSKWIYRVTVADYAAKALFADGRFLTFAERPFPPIQKKLPSKSELLDALYSRVGLPYVWGGNWSKGIPELLDYYPTQKKLLGKEQITHCLQGVDCSGLLYEVTSGITPRNTYDLLHFGREISSQLEPLDLIVWKGHVVIVGKEEDLIESHRLFGVVVTPLKNRLEEILQNHCCVKRRWI